MIPPKHPKSTDYFPKSAAVQSSIIQHYSKSHPKFTSEKNPTDNDKTGASLVRKADTLLREELLGRINRSAEVLRGDRHASQVGLDSSGDILRQQAGKLIDTFMKILKHQPEQLAQIVSQWEGNDRFFKVNDEEAFPLLQVSSSVIPGEVGQIKITLFNDDPQETVEYSLFSTDLVGGSGHRIPAHHVTVFPNPSKIPPGQSVEGRIQIRVPFGTPQGRYAGLIKSEDINQLQVVLQLSVSP